MILHRDFDRYLLLFGRKTARDAKSPVVEVVVGAGLVHECGIRVARRNSAPEGMGALTSATIATRARGRAASASSLRKGKLFVDGVIPLEPVGDYVLFPR